MANQQITQLPPQIGASQQQNQPETTLNDVLTKLKMNKMNIEINSKTGDYDCLEATSKKTFPNLGYAFMGYNILKGFPLAVGQDPGFTYRVFRPDYSNGDQTADCRYSVPLGLLIARDVSCVTSFSSQIVQTEYELQKTLSLSATTAASSGWGVSFSASVGYKQVASVVSDAKVVVIYSTANCNYYISKLEETNPPPFDPEFLKWVKKLNKTIFSNESEEEKTKYFDFFEYYGTHYIHTATFGASYTHEYKMTTSNYTSLREFGVDIAAAANFASQLINLQASFNLAESQKTVANLFMSRAQERTITKGAPPPADGEAKTWASSVQETPIPMIHRLSPLEDLFTQKYMESLGVKYDEINNRIKAYKGEYCSFLRENTAGNCLDFVEVIVLEGTQIVGDVQPKILGRSECYNICQEEKSCVAIDFCNDCTRSDVNYNKCHIYREGVFMETESHNAIETTIWIAKIKREMVLYNTAVVGRERLKSVSTYSDNIQDCLQRCLEDEQCMTFTYCNCSEKIRNCKLYAQDGISRLIAEDGSQTHFLSSKINSVYDIFTTRQPQNLTGSTKSTMS